MVDENSNGQRKVPPTQPTLPAPPPARIPAPVEDGTRHLRKGAGADVNKVVVPTWKDAGARR